jgi:hypothetical protein
MDTKNPIEGTPHAQRYDAARRSARVASRARLDAAADYRAKLISAEAYCEVFAAVKAAHEIFDEEETRFIDACNAP